MIPSNVFMKRDPIVCGVVVEAGVVKTGTPICVPSKDVSGGVSLLAWGLHVPCMTSANLVLQCIPLIRPIELRQLMTAKYGNLN